MATERVVRQCEKHGETTFSRKKLFNKKTGKVYYQESCLICNADWARERARARKLRAIRYKGGKCAICGGVFDPCVYDFHHTDPTVKDSNPSNLMKGNWLKLKEELDKCILVCSNCHRVLHRKLDV